MVLQPSGTSDVSQEAAQVICAEVGAGTYQDTRSKKFNVPKVIEEDWGGGGVERGRKAQLALLLEVSL